MELERYPWTSFPIVFSCPPASYAAFPWGLPCPPFLSSVSEWLPLENGVSQEGRCTIRNADLPRLQHFFPGAFSGMCHRRWERWAGEQRVLGTSNQVIKCLSIPSQNETKTFIFIKSKSPGSTAVRFSELLQKAGETMTKIPVIERQRLVELDDGCFQQLLNLPTTIIPKQSLKLGEGLEPAWMSRESDWFMALPAPY